MPQELSTMVLLDVLAKKHWITQRRSVAHNLCRQAMALDLVYFYISLPFGSKIDFNQADNSHPLLEKLQETVANGFFFFFFPFSLNILLFSIIHFELKSS
jgi:hypothetical protein